MEWLKVKRRRNAKYLIIISFVITLKNAKYSTIIARCSFNKFAHICAHKAK